jgi:hypothetical protein
MERVLQMALRLDLSELDDIEELDFNYDDADEDCMRAVSELLGHHRTDKALMGAYLGASPL